jgi:putative ABC transport system permease protein
MLPPPSPRAPGGQPSTLVGAFFHLWTWRMAWRDSRRQRLRLWLCILSIAAGVSAMVAIHTLKKSLQLGIETQAKSLLGADLMISSRRPIEDDVLAKIPSGIKAVARETAFSSMVSVPGGNHSRLVQVRALAGGYPFYATVDTEPAAVWETLGAGGGILAERALLDEFGLKVGDFLKLGAREFRILGVVKKGVPRSSRFSAFAPEVFIRQPDLESTGLAGAGSLVYHHRSLLLEASSTKELSALVSTIMAAFPERGVEFQTPEKRREAIGESLDRMKEYLGIIALVALMLGGIGVAGAMHSHLKRRLQSIAVLLCLGCSTHLAFGIFLVQACVLGLAGAGLGTILGTGLHAVVLQAAGESLPVQVDLWPEPWVALLSGSSGFVLCCGFAVLPLLQIRGVSPLATLSERPQKRRSDAWAGRAVGALLGLLVFGVAFFNGTSAGRALGLTVGLGIAFLALWGTARLLMGLTRRVLRPSWPYLLRQGVANLYRPHNQTVLFLLSLGLGVFLLLTTWGVRTLLVRQMQFDAKGDGPNLYLVDVQPDQIGAVSEVLRSQELPLINSAPMVTMRIASVNGKKLAPLRERKSDSAGKAQGTEAQRVPRWVMEREYRSTYRAELNATETLVAGELSSSGDGPDPTEVPVSLEQGLAKDLGVGLGGLLVMDVQGMSLNARVTSLRKVDWSKFNLNFFMVFPPGVLEEAPQFQLLATRIPEGKTSAGLQRALLAVAPNVSVVDLTSILSTVASLLEKAVRIVQILSGFTLAAGVPVLLGALLNGREQRVRESVLLRTLGATEVQVRSILVVEYAALGALSGLAGGVLAVGAQLAMARWIFLSAPEIDWHWLVLACFGAISVSTLMGLLLSRGVCKHPPLLLLRGNG